MQYAGFISYSGAAGPIAARLHRALERYVIPKPLRGRQTDVGTIGKSSGKFFVDHAELSATPHLKADIEAALDESRFLIVLCSPQAAQSTWVPFEIAYFKQIGRADRIIPVLVAGKPEIYDPVVSPDGAFPRELLENGAKDMPLAPDLREANPRGEGFDTAMLRIVARLLGLEFPELTQRHLVAEREKQRLRNRVIATLAVLLVLTVAGGWTAWMQKQAAERRLALALESAARQVQMASGFRDRYGVPSSISAELFDGAATDFADIVVDAGDTPMLVLQRARYNLGMADLASDTDGSALSAADYVARAHEDLARARRLSSRWYARFLFAETPDVPAILREEIVALDREARQAVRTGDRGKALALTDRTQALAETLTRLAEAGETPQTVAGHCALADIRYELNDVQAALALRETCLSGAQKLWEADPTPEGEVMLARALIDTATLLRLQRQHQTRAVKLLEDASAMARDGLGGSNDARVLASEALVAYADTINLIDVAQDRKIEGLEKQLGLYRNADDILQDLVAFDANRRDWKVLQASNAYRLVGVTARLVVAAGEDSTLASQSDARLEDAGALLSKNIDMVAGLTGQFPQDLSLQRMYSALLESRAELRVMRVKSLVGDDVSRLDSGVRADLSKVMTIRQTMADNHAEFPFYQRDLANAHLTKGRLLMQLGDGPNVLAPDFHAAREIFKSLSELEGFKEWSARDLALTDFMQSKLHATHGQMGQACPLAKRAASTVKELKAKHPENPRIKNQVSETQALIRDVCE